MCQMRIILKQGDTEEMVLENASTLEIVDQGVMVGAMFEHPILIPGGEVHSIDFLSGRVLVTKKGGKT